MFIRVTILFFAIFTSSAALSQGDDIRLDDPFFGSSSLYHDEFINSSVILADFAAQEGSFEWRSGDSVLYGILMDTGKKRRVWYVLIEAKSGPHSQGEIVRVPDDRNRSDLEFEAESWEQSVPIGEGGPPFRVASDSLFVAVTVYNQRAQANGTSYAMAPEAYLRQGFYESCVEAIPFMPELLSQEKPAKVPRPFMEAGLKTGVALYSFFSLMQDVRDLEPILDEVVEKPSTLSILMKRELSVSMSPKFERAERNDWELPGTGGILECYTLPFEMSAQEKPALHGRLIVTTPASPLALGAGVVGIDGIHPEKPERRFLARLLASRRGAIKH